MASDALLSRDLLRGGLFALIGVGAVVMGSGYDVGTANEMGAGYFPVIIDVLLVVLGLADVARSLISGGGVPMPRLHLWPVLCLVCGVVGFGLLIDGAGLLLAVAVLIGFAFLARKRFNPVEALAIFIVLAALSASLFVFGLGSPLSYLLPH